MPNKALVETLLNGFIAQPVRAPLSSVPTKISVSELAKPDAFTIRQRPSFMYKSGLTSAEKGTAQHEFMQYANFNLAKEDAQKEIGRLVQNNFIDDVVAKKLDLQGIRTFFVSSLAQRFATAKKILKEQDFISAIPAENLDKSLAQNFANENVLVQGVADVVLIFEDHVELVDYKTDQNKTPQQLENLYSRQLNIYRAAMQSRFSVPIEKLTIWSFSLGEEINVPLKNVEFNI